MRKKLLINIIDKYIPQSRDIIKIEDGGYYVKIISKSKHRLFEIVYFKRKRLFKVTGMSYRRD